MQQFCLMYITRQTEEYKFKNENDESNFHFIQ